MIDALKTGNKIFVGATLRVANAFLWQSPPVRDAYGRFYTPLPDFVVEPSESMTLGEQLARG